MRDITLEIINKRGLHARAAAKFVKVVGAHDARVRLVKKGANAEADSPEVEGSSILGLMMLGADPGSKLHITAEGAQEAEVIAALTELLAMRFGENE